MLGLVICLGLIQYLVLLLGILWFGMELLFGFCGFAGFSGFWVLVVFW